MSLFLWYPFKMLVLGYDSEPVLQRALTWRFIPAISLAWPVLTVPVRRRFSGLSLDSCRFLAALFREIVPCPISAMFPRAPRSILQFPLEHGERSWRWEPMARIRSYQVFPV